MVKAIVRSGSPRAKEAVELRDHILGATPVFVAALHAHRKACRELAIHGRADLTSKPTMHDEFRKVSAEGICVKKNELDKTSAVARHPSSGGGPTSWQAAAKQRAADAEQARKDELKRQQRRNSSGSKSWSDGKGCSSIARRGKDGSSGGSCGK